jgi:SlyX protein
MPRKLDAMSNDSLEEVQSKIAFLEQAIAELSDVVFRQHKEIQVLEVQLNAVRARLDSARSDETARSVEEEKPPHY